MAGEWASRTRRATRDGDRARSTTAITRHSARRSVDPACADSRQGRAVDDGSAVEHCRRARICVDEHCANRTTVASCSNAATSSSRRGDRWASRASFERTELRCISASDSCQRSTREGSTRPLPLRICCDRSRVQEQLRATRSARRCRHLDRRDLRSDVLSHCRRSPNNAPSPTSSARWTTRSS